MSKVKAAKDLGIRIIEELADLGIKPDFLGRFTNVKKAFTGGKPTFFKPDVLETLRATDGTFTDALNLIEEEAKFVVNATDAEKMAFLNNLSQYKSLGGPKKTKSSGIASTNVMEQFKKTQSELQKALKDLQSTTEKNKNQALKDLDDLMETGGQPFKKKDNKFLGGSMHEEGQIRTGVRQFLQTEFKNGRINLDDTDKFRVMKYSPMLEDDPIKVFKKIYGDDAYNKAGSFAGAFEKGENFKHYEQIFRENMGEDILKVKNEKYKGDGKLVLTEMEEIKPPIPDDDVPFATGGRAGYGLGDLVKGRSAVAVPGSAPVSSGSGNGLGGLLADMVRNNPEMFTNSQKSQSTLVSNTPVSTNVNQSTPKVDARMNLDYDTLINQNEAQRNLQAQRRNLGIVDPGLMKQALKVDPRAGIKEAFFNERLSGGEQFGDAIPDFDRYGTYTGSDQLIRDYAAAGRGTPTSQLVKLPEGHPYAVSGPGYYEYDGTSFSKTADANMTPEYEKFIRSNYGLDPINQTGMSDPMMTGFDYSQSTDWSPGQTAPDGYRIAEIMGDKFLERMYPSKQEIAGLPGMIGPMPLGLMMPPSGNYEDAGLSGQEYAEKYGIPYARGGRAGYYTGGMIDVEPNLSDIGHGSDSLMARTRLVSPGSQATTSTGLNYLLAEDNDNIRVPFGSGKNFEMYLREREQIERQQKLEQLMREYKDDINKKKVMEQKQMVAEGGRIGFSKGKIAKEVLDKGRRGFMKAAGVGAAGLAALKTGLLGLGEKAAPVVETAVEAAKGVPPYFFQLVDVIKSKGREIKSYGDRVKQYIAPSKDGKSELMLTEDLSTGDIQVKKIHKEGDEMVTKTEEMNFNKGRGDEMTQGTPADDYEEVTSFHSRIYKDEFNDPDFVDGIDVEEIVKEIDVKKTKKADGGRIGFESGKVVLGKKIYELLKNNKKIKEAVDNIFGTGDYKMDAEMAAESLVELNPQTFGNKLYDDLDDATRSEIYGAVLPQIGRGSKYKPGDAITSENFKDTPFAPDTTELKKARALAPQMVERLELKAKYPGITDDLLDKILADDNPQRKAEVIATIDEAFKMMEKGKGTEEIIETFKNTTRTKQASGGLTSMLGE